LIKLVPSHIGAIAKNINFFYQMIQGTADYPKYGGRAFRRPLSRSRRK
jgi:hypothetical protein